LKRGASVLDLGSEDDAAQPFAANGLEVTRAETADALPYPDERFDLVMSAQAFHRFDRTRALAEAHRVLRPGGIVAIWFAHGATQASETTERPMPSGFREFYAADQFFDQTLRVLPRRTPAGMQMQYLYLARRR
jgi:ubiquinone/menaquinone biosynthesis C-methylase UbiE